MGGRPGDLLFLTKPLGTGIITTALDSGLADKECEGARIERARRLQSGTSP